MQRVQNGIFLFLFTFSSMAVATEPKAAMPTQDSQLVAKIAALPNVAIPSGDSNILSHGAEIRRQMKAKSVAETAVVQSLVQLNQPSPITHEAKYSTFVISLRYKVVLNLQGDDLWLIGQGKKKFSESEREMLSRLLSAP